MSVLADIITIGDELMIGQVVDTNSAFIASELTKIGITIRRKIAIPDREIDIIDTLDESTHQSDIVIITGGLGPTSDDITKGTLTKYFKGRLRLHQPSLENVEQIFKARGYKLTERNRKQAELPDTCMPLTNRNGTAPGMLFKKDKCLIFSLPGVPFEMKALILEEVLPIITKSSDLPVLLHKTILTTGIGESYVADLIKDWEEMLPPDLSLAYLPSPGILRLRITISGDEKEAANKVLKRKVDELAAILGDKNVYGFDDDTLENIVGRKLKENKLTISVAESITGGLIGHLITSVPGASEYFMGSAVTYSNNAKNELLNVSEQDLRNEGAVSKTIVEQMARGAQEIFKTSFSIATSGIAGPGGGTNSKPVGTTWIAIATPVKVLSQKFLFGDSRERNIIRTSLTALNLLRIEIDEYTKNSR